MIRLTELRKLARKSFAGEPPDAVRILYAWAENDPDGVLGLALAQIDSNTKHFQGALRPLLETRYHDDALLVSHCLHQAGTEADIRQLLDLLLGKTNHRIVQALAQNGIDLPVLTQKFDEVESSSEGTGPMESRDLDDLSLYGIRLHEPADEILKYGRDLTGLAKTGAFSGLLEREAELEILTDILLRKNKPNVAITGPAGTGKTALVETFAVRLARNAVPQRLKGARLFEIGLGALVAGTRYRGDFEERLMRVLDNLKSIKDAILFIDEMHLIAGAGSAEGINTDASNILKPYLARGEIRVIGATTHDEYHRYIAKDKALARRFQELQVTEPGLETVLEMVGYQAIALSEHHKVQIDRGILSTAVELGNRFFPNRFQPDKTVDLLDSTAARVSREERSYLTELDLFKTISRITGQALENLTAGGLDSLCNLSDRLNAQVIGQKEAVSKVTARLIQQRMGLGQPDRCQGVFLFAGDTGVGKTSLARAIGEELFPERNAVLTIDLGEFSQPGSVNNLIGVPRGYRGMDEECLLSGWLRERSEGVLVLDEVEKAHPEIHRLLLGLLDQGRIRDPRGDVLDARRHVIVLTTNALTPGVLRRQSMGFHSGELHPDPFDLLSAEFPSEFLSRLDEIIVFNPLGPKEIRRIVELRLNEAMEGLSRRGVVIEFDADRLIDRIQSAAEVTRSGARGVARTIERMILQPVAKALLAASPDKSLRLRFDGNHLSAECMDDKQRDNDKVLA